MVLPGVDNNTSPVFSARWYSNSAKVDDNNNIVPRRLQRCPPPPPHACEALHNHTNFCPASRTGCQLFRCQIHRCNCAPLINTSTIIASVVAGAFAVIVLSASIAYSQFSFNKDVDDGDKCTVMSVSQILWKYDTSEEMKRQLKLLHHAHVGNCKWKESSDCMGLANLAALELGSTITSTYDTIPYSSPFCGHVNSRSYCNKNCPQQILQHDVIPGRNFNFVGKGKVLIQLAGPAVISGFTLHHPPKEILPNGFINAAPNKFEVKGYYGNPPEEFSFGTFNYLNSSTSAQAFPIKRYLEKKIDLIQVLFLTNHGNPNYTAVYRFEVHGDI